MNILFGIKSFSLLVLEMKSLKAQVFFSNSEKEIPNSLILYIFT